MSAKTAHRKVLGSVSKNWISHNSTKGGLFASIGGRIPEGVGLPPLISATAVEYFQKKNLECINHLTEFSECHFLSTSGCYTFV